MAGVLDIPESVVLGLHAMAYLAGEEKAASAMARASHKGAGWKPAAKPVRTQEMVAAFHISQAHLYKVMARLEKAGLVAAVRGKRGGFLLARESSKVRLMDVYEAISGRLAAGDCLLSRKVCGSGGCILGRLLSSVKADLTAYLSRTKLSDLATAAK